MMELGTSCILAAGEPLFRAYQTASLHWHDSSLGHKIWCCCLVLMDLSGLYFTACSLSVQNDSETLARFCGMMRVFVFS